MFQKKICCVESYLAVSGSIFECSLVAFDCVFGRSLMDFVVFLGVFDGFWWCVWVFFDGVWVFGGLLEHRFLVDSIRLMRFVSFLTVWHV